MTARRGVRRYVVDASVAVKWLFDDADHVPQARALHDACLIGAPTSLAYDAPTSLAYDGSYVALADDGSYVALADDGSYVALADELGVECWSGDERLVRASERGAPYVRSIGEYAA